MLQTTRLRDDGGPGLSPDALVNAFWEALNSFLPPQGALVLARADAGHLIACGALSNIGDGIGELKYLYVRPEARNTGLGRALVQSRIDIAREMGLSCIFADTLKASVEMHGLYEDMGFERVNSLPKSKTLRDFAELTPFMFFYKLHLGPTA
ncbi:MAG: GNAT family N-acetyltransferase [Pseudomonadota bacterium]